MEYTNIEVLLINGYSPVANEIIRIVAASNFHPSYYRLNLSSIDQIDLSIRSWDLAVIIDDSQIDREYRNFQKVIESIDGAAILAVTPNFTKDRVMFFLKHSTTEIMESDNLESLQQSLSSLLECSKRNKRIQQDLRVFSALRNSRNVVLLTDSSGLIEFINPSFTHNLGYQIGEVQKKPIKIIEGQDSIQNGLYDAHLKVTYEKVSRTEQIQLKKKNGETLWVLASISPILNKNQDVSHLVYVCEDVSGSKEYNDDLQKMAYTDPVTHLGNRNYFKDQYLQAFRHAKRENKALAILCIDLDNFKYINDTYGHMGGDSLLQTIATRLSSSVRETDSVARMGGDEFSIILTINKNSDDAEKVAVKIIEKMNEPVVVINQSELITCSIGISISSDNCKDFETHYKQADEALYKAKESGKNNYYFYDSEMNKIAHRSQHTGSDVKFILDENSIEVYAQSIYATDTSFQTSHAKAAVELHLKWRHPDFGLLSASKFMNSIERDSDVIELGKWVTSKAVKLIKECSTSGVSIPIIMSLSTVEFYKDETLENFILTCNDNNIDPSQLRLTVSEDVMKKNINEGVRLAKAYRSAGFDIIMDKFGKVSACLKTPYTYKVSQIKTHRSLLNYNESNFSFLKGIMATSEVLNIPIIVSGVETQEQSNFISEFRNIWVQGNFYERLIPVDEYIEKSAKVEKNELTAKY